VLERAPVACSIDSCAVRAARGQGVAPTWLDCLERWERTSTLTPKTRASVTWAVLKAGRWLQAHHPTVSAPGEWTRDLAVAYVAAVDRMHAGDYVQRTAGLQAGRVGQPLSPRAKDRCLQCLRAFFTDLQEWGWIAGRFNPARALATPRAVKAAIGPAPRIIADDIWAKLLWAGLHLTEDDLLVDCGQGHAGPPTRRLNRYYPLAMVRALAVTWLFTGLRSDEIVRLRVGCVRENTRPGATEPSSEHSVCLLDVPVHKTGHAFTKPVDAVVREAISAWEAVRPQQPDFPDRKTGESAQLLFCFRARPVPRNYLNEGLIPLLCRKAGVPRTDARGRISSPRARSTIASQLFNAREPMTLFELQAWLGHRSPETTQNYVACTPTRLFQSYRDAGYFARNVRAIEGLSRFCGHLLRLVGSDLLGSPDLFELRGSPVTKARVQALAVVEDLDPLEDGLSSLLARVPDVVLDQLGL
jgi:integrase